jgi:hypothetical protein
VVDSNGTLVSDLPNIWPTEYLLRFNVRVGNSVVPIDLYDDDNVDLFFGRLQVLIPNTRIERIIADFGCININQSDDGAFQIVKAKYRDQKVSKLLDTEGSVEGVSVEAQVS